MNTNLRQALWTTALAALSLGPLLAQDLTGTWQGTLKTATGKQIRLTAKITRAPGDNLTATLYTIDQPSQPVPATSVTLSGRDLKIDFPSILATYEGSLSPDGNSLTGTFKQGLALPLDFQRATLSTTWPIPSPQGPTQLMSTAVDPAFATVSIKPAALDHEDMSILTDPIGRFAATHTTLKDLIVFAYTVLPAQIQNLPPWAESEKFDIAAKPDHPGVGNGNQIRSMVKKLLLERFNLAFHLEQKELPAFTLTRGPSAPRLTAAQNPNSLPDFISRGPGSVSVRNATMAQFATYLQTSVVDRPVTDKTGLAGKYDFTLTWRPDLPTAIQQQLGLQLNSGYAAVEVLVINQATKPTTN